MTLIMKSGTKLQKINKRNAKCAGGKGAGEGGREGRGGVRVRRGVRGLNTRPPLSPRAMGMGVGNGEWNAFGGIISYIQRVSQCV